MRRKIRSLVKNKKTEKLKCVSDRVANFDLQNYDFTLIVLVTIIVIFGVVMVFSASYYAAINSEGNPYSFLKKDVVLAAAGFVIMFVCAHIIDYRLFKKYNRVIIAVAILLLIAVMVPGVGIEKNGATRWIYVGFTVMPGELAKPAVLVFTASVFSKNAKRIKQFKYIVPVLAIVGGMAVLIIMQPNLSTAITLVLLCGGIMFIAGLPWIYVGICAIGGTCVVAAKIISEGGYQQDRVISFMDPFAQMGGDGYQVAQSLLAFGTGGFTGVGLGKSVQKNLYLPEAQTDFILSIIGEELGFVRVLILLGLFFMIVYKCFSIGVRAQDRFGMLLCCGVGILIGVQVVFNLAIVTSSMPPTGVALPFISYGGNSLWIFMGLIGMVLNVDKQSKESERKLQ